MADDFATALQKGLIAALKADSAVTALVGARVYDEPPQNATFPYLWITEITPYAFDTDCTEGAQVQIGLEAQSRAASGRVEAVRVAEAVKNALHRQEGAVTVSGFNLIETRFQTFITTREPDGRGYSSRIALQAMLEASA